MFHSTCCDGISKCEELFLMPGFHFGRPKLLLAALMEKKGSEISRWFLQSRCRAFWVLVFWFLTSCLKTKRWSSSCLIKKSSIGDSMSASYLIRIMMATQIHTTDKRHGFFGGFCVGFPKICWKTPPKNMVILKVSALTKEKRDPPLPPACRRALRFPTLCTKMARSPASWPPFSA